MSRRNPRSDVNLRVEVLDNLISVSFTGTRFCVIYRKPTEQSAFGPQAFRGKRTLAQPRSLAFSLWRGSSQTKRPESWGGLRSHGPAECPQSPGRPLLHPEHDDRDERHLSGGGARCQGL
jgi:hypothetical protein